MSTGAGWTFGTVFETPSEGSGRNMAFQVWYPIVLAAVSLIALAFPQPKMILGELFVGSTIAWVTLLALCTGRSKLRISRILGTGLLTGYSVGSLPSAINSLRGGPNDFTGGYGLQAYTLAFCQIFCGVALLWAVGELTLPYLPLPELSRESYRRLRVFTWIGTVLVVLAFAHGDLAFMGTVSEAGEGVNIIGIFASWMVFTLPGCTCDVIATAKDLRSRLLYGSLLVFQFVCIIPIGRRFFLYSLLLGFTVFCHRRPRFGRSPVKVGLLLALSGAVISVVWTAFLYMRVAGYAVAGESVSAVELVERAWDLYNSPDAVPISELWAGSGVEERTNLVQYNMQLLTAAQSGTPAHGGGALNQFKWTVPHVFWPTKQALIEEDYAAQQFGLEIPDQPNSLFSAGTIDFGFMGGIAYPLLISWLLAFGLRLCFRYYPSPVPNICYYYYITILMSTEQELGSYFSTVRDTLLWGFLLAILFFFVARMQVFKPERMLQARPRRAGL